MGRGLKQDHPAKVGKDGADVRGRGHLARKNPAPLRDGALGNFPQRRGEGDLEPAR